MAYLTSSIPEWWWLGRTPFWGKQNRWHTTLVTGPTEEPVDIDEAKQWLRLEVDDDNAMVQTLITVARRIVENRCQRKLVTQTWDYFSDTFPAYEFVLPYSPISSVTWVKYYDSTGTLTTLDPTLYMSSLGNVGRLTPKPYAQWPVGQVRLDTVNVRYVVGYGDAGATPEEARLAMKVLILWLYENRMAVEANPPFEVIDLILDPIRQRGYLA